MEQQRVFMKGEHVRILRNVSPLKAGDVVEVTIAPIRPTNTNPYYTVKKVKKDGTLNTSSQSIYHNELEPLDRKERIKHLKQHVKGLETEIKQYKSEIDFLKNYESEADYTAHKIVDILKNKNDVEAVRAILEKRPTSFI